MDSRLYVGNFSFDTGSGVFCEAAHRSIAGANRLTLDGGAQCVQEAAGPEVSGVCADGPGRGGELAPVRAR